nr:hypothetical protein [Tanacetum cinerariifolium]
VGSTCAYTMVDMNIPTNDAPAEQAPAIAPPTRTDDQIFPCQLDEQWFNLHKDILRDALDITPTNANNPFVAPPSSDIVFEYVNTLGYPSTLKNVSAMSVNALYQSWRAILSMINMCLTGFGNSLFNPYKPFSLTGRILLRLHAERKRPLICLSQALGLLERMVGKYLVCRYMMLFLLMKLKEHPTTANTTSMLLSINNIWMLNMTRQRRDKQQRLLKLPRLLNPSLKEQVERTQGLARPVVIREHDSGRIQPLLDVQGKGKEKVVDEQAAHDLLTLSTPKNKSLVDQYIIQSHTFMPTEASGVAESPSLDAELALADSEMKSDDVVPKINTAGSNPSDVAESQPQSSHVVHAGPNLEHMDLEATDALIHQNPEKMDEEFTTTTYLNEEDPRKTNAEAEVQSMISVLIHQDTSSVPLMTTPVIDLTSSQSGSPLSTLTATTSTVSKAVNEIVTDTVDWEMQAPLRACFSDMPTVDMKEILQQRMFENKSYKAHEDHKKLYDALEKSLETPSGSPLPQPPPPPPPVGASGTPDVKNNWATMLVSTYQTPAENSLLAKTRDMTNFLNWYCRQVNKTKLTQANLEGQAYEVVKAFYPDVIHLQFQMEECHNKGSSPALLIFKMKVASYPDFGLELLVPEQMWIDDVPDSPSCQKEVRSHIRILNVVIIKAYSRYGYDYLSKIILRIADLQEHTIAKKDFKNLYPSDFEDLNLLLLQGHIDHLLGSDKQMLSTVVKLWTRNIVIRQRVKDFQLGIKSYHTQLNLTKLGWDATGYEFKHDYTINESPRAVVFPIQGIQDQAAQSGYEYVILDSNGRDKEQRVHTGYRKETEDEKDLSKPGMLYSWTSS